MTMSNKTIIVPYRSTYMDRLLSDYHDLRYGKDVRGLKFPEYLRDQLGASDVSLVEFQLGDIDRDDASFDTVKYGYAITWESSERLLAALLVNDLRPISVNQWRVV